MRGFSAPDPPEKAAECAVKMVEQGYTLFKLDPLPPMCNPQPRDVDLKELRYVDALFKAMRDAVGDECDISLGTHGQFTTHSAIRLAKILERYDALWFEEPIPLENVDEMARLAAHTTVPIAQGERLCTKWEFRQLLDHHAAQIIQLNVGTSGILESKKIAGMAEAYYASVAPWHYSGPVSHAASIQLDVTLPNILAQEGNLGPFHSEIVEYPVKIEDGFVIPSNEPGLGFGRVKEELFDDHPYMPEHPRFDGEAGKKYAESTMKALVTTKGILL